MTAMPRLITRTDALIRLLAAIAAVPEGVKLSIPQLRDALVSQADVLAGIETLVAGRKLDPATLRTPVKAAPAPRPEGLRRGQSADGEPAQPLFDALVAEGKRRGLSTQALSLAVFGGKSRIYYLTRPGATARRKTADKIRAWLASPAAVPGSPAAPPSARAEPSDAPNQLLREIRAFCGEHGVTLSRFGLAAAGDAKLAARLECCASVRPKTVAKIRAFLAEPSIEALRSRAPAGDRRHADNRVDQASKPHRPRGWAGLSTEARAAAARLGNRTKAEKLLAGEPTGGGRISPVVRAAANVIQDTRDAQARQTDPVEAAKLALQRKGRTVYAASVVGGPKNRFVVSGMGREVTPAALIAEAERVCGLSFRREAVAAAPHANPAAPTAGQGRSG